MKLVFILGDAAVGKMTVGQELMKITDLRLFHNHITIEPVLEVFGEWNFNVISECRDVMFREFAKTDKYGMIATLMFAFDEQEDWDYLEHIKDIFKPYDMEFYYVELFAPQEIRLQRNVTENRLKHKASKRDIEISNKRLLNDDASHRFVSYDGEVEFDNYIKIDNSDLPPEKVAEMIKEEFNL